LNAGTIYGSNTASQNLSGNTYQNASANSTGLNGSTTYHFRIVATNSAGTAYGSDKTFAMPYQNEPSTHRPRGAVRHRRGEAIAPKREISKIFQKKS
jgi:hypothetical protein